MEIALEILGGNPCLIHSIINIRCISSNVFVSHIIIGSYIIYDLVIAKQIALGHNLRTGATTTESSGSIKTN